MHSVKVQAQKDDEVGRRKCVCGTFSNHSTIYDLIDVRYIFAVQTTSVYILTWHDPIGVQTFVSLELYYYCNYQH